MKFSADNQPANRGRKSLAEKYERPISAAEKKIVDRLPQLVGNLLTRADGGYEVVTEEWQPAGMVQIEAHDFDDKGRILKTKAPAFPHLPPEQLVLVKRRVSIADSDVGAAEYLLDRIMGKPISREEVTGTDGGPISIDLAERDRRLATLAEHARTRLARQRSSQPE